MRMPMFSTSILPWAAVTDSITQSAISVSSVISPGDTSCHRETCAADIPQPIRKSLKWSRGLSGHRHAERIPDRHTENCPENRS